MHSKTSSLPSTSLSSLNTPAENAIFYTFYILPEWISVTILLGFNISKYQALGRSAIGVDKPSQRWGDGRNMQMFYFYF
jgi:hypothetical protein